MTDLDADVAVVGLGALGASTLWRLAHRGISVLGIERFGIGHEYGSTHGATRLFRVACLEHPGLVPVAFRAKALWNELEEISGEELLLPTGSLTIGPPDSRGIAGAVEAAKVNDLAIRRLTLDEIRQQFPQHTNIPSNHVGLWDPHAGVVRPEAGVRAACNAAQSRGAQVFSHTAVTSIDRRNAGRVVIHTATTSFTVRQVVLTIGPWLSQLAPEMPAQAVRTPMMWFSPEDKENPEDYTLSRFPVFIRYIDESVSLWGHGATLGHDIKIGLEDNGLHFKDVNADQLDRGIEPRQDWKTLHDTIKEYFHGIDPVPIRAIPCMITNSPDGQFLLGRPNDDPSVIIGGGCSGHGFKHAPALGEALAQITVNENLFTDFGFTNPDRVL